MMKITAGLGSTDEYIRFVEAGADEFFSGFVPYSWTEKYATVMPLNRREVLCYHVQLGAFSELEILSEMVRKYKKPVHLTFNSLYYIPQQYPEIAEIIQNCMKLGFRSYIIADPALIVYLRERGIPCEIHLSGETGEINRRMVEAFQRLDLKRVIFHRKNNFADMQSVIQSEKNAGGRRAETEFEAFVLNEMCQFTGAFCNSLHCDELGHLCRVPYWMEPIRKIAENKPKCAEGFFEGKTETAVVADKFDDGNEKDTDTDTDEKYDASGYLCGATGCGLCALYRLRDAGITHLKLVGRGNYTDFMEKDIRNLRKALQILESTATETDFRAEMKEQIFPFGCSGNCYYL